MADCIEQMKNYVLNEELMHDLESIHDLCASYAGCHTGMVEGAFGELETMLDSVIFDIKQRVTVEVQPVVWGEWIVHDSGAGDISYECNICREISCCRANFCPDCGANMRREDEQA